MKKTEESAASILAKPILVSELHIAPVPSFPSPSGSTIKRKSIKKIHVSYYVVLALLLPLTVFSSIKLAKYGWSNMQIAEAHSAEPVSGDNPSEEAVTPDVLASYKVSAKKPRTISIPSLGIEARVMHTGVTASGAIDAPANINDVSWYKDSATPSSETGISLLLGHLSGKTMSGVFKQLHKLQANDSITVTNGDGSKVLYKVIRGETKPASDISMDKLLFGDGSYDALLMTCAGKYNKQEQRYADRTIIYLKKVL